MLRYDAKQVKGFVCPFCRKGYDSHYSAMACCEDKVEVENIWECEICGDKFLHTNDAIGCCSIESLVDVLTEAEEMDKPEVFNRLLRAKEIRDYNKKEGGR
jgi:hypothetical protein